MRVQHNHSGNILDDGMPASGCHGYHARCPHDMAGCHGLERDLQELLEGNTVVLYLCVLSVDI